MKIFNSHKVDTLKKIRSRKFFISAFITLGLFSFNACQTKEKDIEKPIITLNGNVSSELKPGEGYSEAGASAKDNIDGDISNKIKIEYYFKDKLVDKIDSNVIGDYTVKYSVTDSSNNEAEQKIRTISVIKPQKIVYVISKSEKLRKTNEKNAEIIGTLTKGAELVMVEEKNDADGLNWLKVEYLENDKKISAWIKKEATTEDKKMLFHSSFRNLDYDKYEKLEYPNNPKVKVKGIYLTVYSAGGQKLDSLIEMTKRTEINAFVIDVKDDNGHLLFPMEAGNKYAPNANKNNMVKDIKALMKKLKDNNIYTIARIVSFKDPIYTETYPERAIIYKNSGQPFTNSDNLRWASAYDRKLWEYNIAVAKEAIDAGFNEIQFDYVRFPASNGGKLDKILDYRNEKNETKAQALQEYLKYARKEISPKGVYISADVYGLVSSVEDDMALGQYWEAFSNIVDYICPMAYPSHYGNGSYGLSVPDAFPYETVFRTTKDGIKRNNLLDSPSTIRPWIQDFTAPWVKGHIKYGDLQVKEQIRALKENGVEEYLLWNASNRYSEGALVK